MAPTLLKRPCPEISQAPIKYLKSSQSICTCKDVVELDLGHSWSRLRETQALTSILGTDLLKAAWILTLGRFLPEDVTTLSYEDDTFSRFELPAIFTVRVDPDWNVRTLLDKLEVQKASGASSECNGTQITKPGYFGTSCTSSLIYTTTSDLCLARSSSGSGNLKVGMLVFETLVRP